MKPLLWLSLIFLNLLWGEEVYATFDVRAYQESELTLSFTGIVKRVHTDVGERVKAGEVLLELDNEELRQSVKLAEAELQLAQIQYTFAKKTYERYLQVKEVIDADQLDLHALNHEKSFQSLNRSKVALAYRKALLEKSILYAPYAGRIAKRHIEAGDGVSSAKLSPLFTLIDTERVKLLVYFDEKYWDKVHVGNRFTYRVDGVDKTFEGEIAKIYPTVNAKTRKATAEVYAAGLMPGLFGEGTIEAQ